MHTHTVPHLFSPTPTGYHHAQIPLSSGGGAIKYGNSIGKRGGGMGDETGEKAVVILDRRTGSGLSLMFFVQPVFMTESVANFEVFCPVLLPCSSYASPFHIFGTATFLGGVGIKCINDESEKVFLEDISATVAGRGGHLLHGKRPATQPHFGPTLFPTTVNYSVLTGSTRGG